MLQSCVEVMITCFVAHQHASPPSQQANCSYLRFLIGLPVPLYAPSTSICPYSGSSNVIWLMCWVMVAVWGRVVVQRHMPSHRHANGLRVCPWSHTWLVNDDIGTRYSGNEIVLAPANTVGVAWRPMLVAILLVDASHTYHLMGVREKIMMGVKDYDGCEKVMRCEIV